MLINVKDNEPTRLDVDLAMLDVIKHEYAKERAEAEQRDQTARWVAQNLHTDKTTAIGKCIAVVPLEDDIRLNQKYGRHMFEKSFWKYYQKHHKEMCPAKI